MEVGVCRALLLLVVVVLTRAVVVTLLAFVVLAYTESESFCRALEAIAEAGLKGEACAVVVLVINKGDFLA